MLSRFQPNRGNFKEVRGSRSLACRVVEFLTMPGCRRASHRDAARQQLSSRGRGRRSHRGWRRARPGLGVLGPIAQVGCARARSGWAGARSRQPVEGLVQDGRISRRHASVQMREGRYRACDHGSRNGTAVDGRPIPASVWGAGRSLPAHWRDLFLPIRDVRPLQRACSRC